MEKLADRALTRRQIEGMIASGRAVFIYKGNVVMVDAWMPFHPGGDTAIRHMVGRDATDEVSAYVSLLFLYFFIFLFFTPPRHHLSKIEPDLLVYLSQASLAGGAAASEILCYRQIRRAVGQFPATD